MKSATRNPILIGMPAAGKSTVGVLLAKLLGVAFVDTDILIQTGEGCLLQEIITDQRALHGETSSALSTLLDDIIGPGESVPLSPSAKP